MKPTIFIASSVEGKDVADALQVGLEYDMRCTVWHQAFPLSQNTIDTLLKKCATHDFAVFVFSPDDQLTMRNEQHEVVRDNVLFESGLFMGMHGKERAFIVAPQGSKLFHVPSDLLGFTKATYDPEWARTDPVPAVGSAVTRIRMAIRASSWSSLKPEITATAEMDTNSGATFPLKLRLTVENNQNVPVLIESNGFIYSSFVPPAPNAKLRIGPVYPFEFLFGKDHTGKDVYVSRYVLGSGQRAISWIPIDPSYGLLALKENVKNRNAGTLRFRCVWLGVPTITQNYTDDL